MLSNFSQNHLTTKPVILTIGNFDGFHLGHRYIFHIMKQEAQKLGGSTVLMTFKPNPKEFFQNESFLGRIDSPEQQLKRLQTIGFDAVSVLNFDEFIANCQPKEFIHTFLLQQFNLKLIVTGENFKFGKNRQGNIELLKQEGQQHGFDVKILEPVLSHNLMISSTQIRSWIWEGHFQKVAESLKRPYSIQGKVQKGSQLARTLGVPTANLSFEFKLPLKYGVYAAIVKYQQQNFHAVMNWGVKPTFAKEKPLLEVYLLNFEGCLYGQTLEVIPQKRLRSEIKFDSISDLKEQIQCDLQQVQNFFKTIYHEILLS